MIFLFRINIITLKGGDKMSEKIKKQLNKIKLKNFIFLTIAGIINSIGVTMFLTPVNLYDSGISGTSVLLSQITPWDLSIFLLLLNIPLFYLGLKNKVLLLLYMLFILYLYIPYRHFLLLIYFR